MTKKSPKKPEKKSPPPAPAKKPAAPAPEAEGDEHRSNKPRNPFITAQPPRHDGRRS